MSYSDLKLLLRNVTGGSGDTTTPDATLCEVGTRPAELVGRESELRRGTEPRVNVNGIEQLVIPAIRATICNGDTTEAQSCRQPLSPTPAHSISQAPRFAAVPPSEERPAKHQSRELEEELQFRLRNLQVYICELLSKNQELRMTLMAAEGATQLAGQVGGTAGGVPESAAGAKQIRQELTETAWRIGGAGLRALL